MMGLRRTNWQSGLLRSLVLPHGVVAWTVLLSGLAWICPSLGVLRKGFVYPAKLSLVGAMVLALWYLLIMVSAWIGFKLGVAMEPVVLGPRSRATPLSDPLAYGLLSAAGAVGAVAVYAHLASALGLTRMLLTVVSGQANELKIALYEQYSIGVFSLRYVVILSAGQALYHRLIRRPGWLLDAANIFMLLAIALVASRMAIAFAVVVGVGLWILHNPRPRIRRRYGLGVPLLLFLVFSGYNYSRNAQYYSNVEQQGFLLAGVSEVVAYLGAPFQGAAVAGNRLGQLHAHAYDVSAVTGIDPSLTTDSALLSLGVSYGAGAFPLMVGSCFVAALVMGLLFYRRRCQSMTVYFVLLYCFAELWRLYLFGQGIILTLLVLGVLALWVPRLLRWLHVTGVVRRACSARGQ